MSKRYYLETTTSGRQQFVLKRSRSHGHHHHHHYRHHHDPSCKVSYEEWKNLLERERTLEESNRALCAENNALRGSLSSAEGENHRLTSVVVPQLQAQVAALEADNKSLRRSIENAGGWSAKHHREMDKLNDKISKLEAENREVKEENTDLKIRVKALSKQLDQSFNRRIADLIKEADYWHDYACKQKTKYEDISRRYEAMFDTMERQLRDIDRLKELLRRRQSVFAHA
ncbi:hypothetical protein HJFPF1_00482 [Paramyrothecium foliicola]|nr:hypothetical protein HJFPF1_00482 [Paramyrothecium foliicola]